MKFIPKAFGAALCFSAMILSTASHAADEINKHSFKIAFVQTKNHPHGLGAKKFAEAVKEKSDGKMKVMIFASGTLGGDTQVISSVHGGICPHASAGGTRFTRSSMGGQKRVNGWHCSKNLSVSWILSRNLLMAVTSKPTSTAPVQEVLSHNPLVKVVRAIPQKFIWPSIVTAYRLSFQ